MGITILFVSHDVYSVRNFCDRAVWINEGRLEQIGATLDVTASYIEYMSREQTPVVLDNISENKKVEETSFNPINRWGSHVGLIKSAVLYNYKSQPTA